jgi:hypothetical protein
MTNATPRALVAAAIDYAGDRYAATCTGFYRDADDILTAVVRFNNREQAGAAWFASFYVMRDGFDRRLKWWIHECWS